VLAFIGTDSMQKRVYGHAKQCAAFGHTKIQGKSVLATGPERARRRDQHAGRRTGDRRREATRRKRGLPSGAAGLTASATAWDCGCTGTVIVQADSGYYNCAVIAAIRRGGARFSVTVPVNSKVKAAIAAVPDDAWTPIR
jgi:hypothetical protein